MMRAAHSIKGGAACVGLMGVQHIAHDLENGIRALYAEDTVFDLALEELLLQAFDCLRSPIVEQIETGFCDEEAAITRSQPIFEQLEAKLGHPLEEAAELPEVPMEGDMTAFLFDEEVPSGLRRWENVLKSGNESKIQAELKTQAEVFSTLGSMLGLSGFSAIADTVLEALEANPQACHQIGQIALKDLWASREAVLAGDRSLGGTPSETLTALTQPIPIQTPIVVDVSAEAEADDPSDLFILPPLQETPLEPSQTTELTLSELLLQGLEYLRLPLLEQIETGRLYIDETIDKIQEIVQHLEAILGCSLQEITHSSEANATLLGEIESKYTTQIDTELREEFKTQMEVFVTLGQMLNQPQLSALASTSIDALENNSQGMLTIGLLVFTGIYAQQKAQWQEQGIALPALPVSTETVKDNEAELEEIVAPQSQQLSAYTMLEFAQELQEFEPELDPGIHVESIADTDSTETELTLSADVDEFVDEESLNSDISSLTLEENDSDETLSEVTPFVFENKLNKEIESEEIIPEKTDTDEIKNQAYDWENKTVYTTNFESQEISESQNQQPIQSSSNGIHTPPNTDHELQPKTVFSESNNPPKAPIQPQLSLGVRVDVTRLDQLNNLVGELATQDNSLLLQNQKAQESIDLLERSREKFRKLSVDLQTRARFISQQKQSNSRTALEANALSNSVQETLEELDQIRASIYDMKLLNLQSQQIIKKRQQTLHKVQKNLTETRMVAVESLLNRFPRMVRDLSVRTQKSIHLELTGEKTLVDKAILEKLYDPLVHLVRNAFDHGIELPELRLEQGKPPEGKIEIKAYHQGNYTYIEVIDDGQGIDIHKIRNKAIAQQIISVQDAARLSKKQLYDLLFYPGFSTTEKVSEISGRGVGLEAVRHQFEALKGTITIQSQPGKGTQFILRLPWTLTITKLLVFRVKNSLFSIPMDALAGIVSVSAKDLKIDETTSATPDEQPPKIYDWYGQKVPLVQSVLLEYHHPFAAALTAHKSTEITNDSPSEKSSRKVMLLLISQGLETIALKIDQILMEQNLTIKPFDKILAAPPFCYGCTILGDGRLVPVVDSPELLEHWRQQQQSHLNTLNLKSDQPKRIPHSNPTILVIDDSLTTRASLSSTLQKAGYEVVQAKQGREGLTQLQRHSKIQVVICDLEMPEMNGFEFLTHCRRQYSQAELPVIILTSRNNDRHRQLAKQLGSNQYLTKPWKEQELIQTLQQLQTQSMAVV
jgi:chemotaxis family two-component system sensor histidine kinase/response regulator PixL